MDGAEDPDRVWLRDRFRPHEPQLTVRAALAGMALGALMCLSNLYVVLKTGWSFGVTITSCILAFALFRALERARIVRDGLGILENNALASVASAAGYMTGGGNMAALPALLILTGTRPSPFGLVAWFAVIAALGVLAAIPLKRQLINREALPFPTGTATAETLRSLHGHDAGATRSARVLGLAGLLGGALAFLREAPAGWLPLRVPGHLPLPFSLRGRPAADYTLSFDTSLLLVGAGGLIGFRTGWSLLLGTIATYALLAPELVERGLVSAASYREIVRFTLWGGAAILVSAALTTFALDGRRLVRSLAGLPRLLRGGPPGGAAADPLAAIEAPGWWCALGFALLSPVVVVLMNWLFDVPVWAALCSLPLALVMAVVAARVTGETDTTPTKALGPVTQLVYGVLLPGHLPANIMGANVTGGVGLHAADLLTDVKSGYLLGARPRQQVIAQLFGVVAGALMVVPAFNLLVPDANVLGGERLPAPSALVWAGVSRALVAGLDALAPVLRLEIALGAAAGVGLTLLERFAPARLRRFVPAPSGLGIALIVPGSNALAMFTGALLAEGARRRAGARAEAWIVPTSSGLIAGESLIGVALALTTALGGGR